MEIKTIDFVIYKLIPFLCVVGPLLIILWHLTSQNACNRTLKFIRKISHFLTSFKRGCENIINTPSPFSKKFDLIGEVVDFFKDESGGNDECDVEIDRDPSCNAIACKRQQKLITKYYVIIKIDNENNKLDVSEVFFKKVELLKTNGDKPFLIMMECHKKLFGNVVYINDII